jgi:hypothetical protein
VETGIPANQLLQLKVSDLLGVKVGEEIRCLPADKRNNCSVSKGPNTYSSFRRFVEKTNPPPDEYLFKSRKGSGPLSISSASRLVILGHKYINYVTKW